MVPMKLRTGGILNEFFFQIETAVSKCDRPKDSRGAFKNEDWKSLIHALAEKRYIIAENIRSDLECRVVLSSRTLVRQYYSHGMTDKPTTLRIRTVAEEEIDKGIDVKTAFDLIRSRIKKLVKGVSSLDTQFEVDKFLVTVLEFKNQNIRMENGRFPLMTSAIMVHRAKSAADYSFMLNAVGDFLSGVLGKPFDKYPAVVLTDEDPAITHALKTSALTQPSNHLYCGIHLKMTMQRNMKKHGLDDEEQARLKKLIFGNDDYGNGGVLAELDDKVFDKDVKDALLELSSHPQFIKW